MAGTGFLPAIAVFGRSIGRTDAWRGISPLCPFRSGTAGSRSSSGNLDFSLSDEDAELRELGESHAVTVLARGRLRIDRTGLTVEGTSVPLAHMQSPSLCHFGQGETMMFTAQGKTYELLFPRPKKVQPPSIRKYQLLLAALLEKDRETGEDRAC